MKQALWRGFLAGLLAGTVGYLWSIGQHDESLASFVWQLPLFYLCYHVVDGWFSNRETMRFLKESEARMEAHAEEFRLRMDEIEERRRIRMALHPEFYDQDGNFKPPWS